jgi:DNA-binding transcriptional ArsR family regulator
VNATDRLNETEAQVGHVFAALADPTRRRLLDLLGPRPASSATALATQLPVSRQAVVQHLAVLEGAGLVTSRRAGREVLFSVHPGQLGVAASWLTDRAGAWQESLQALKRAAESASDPASAGARPRSPE